MIILNFSDVSRCFTLGNGIITKYPKELESAERINIISSFSGVTEA